MTDVRRIVGDVLILGASANANDAKKAAIEAAAQSQAVAAALDSAEADRELARDERERRAKARHFLVLGDRAFDAKEHAVAAEHYAVAAAAFPWRSWLRPHGVSGEAWATYRSAIATREAGAFGAAVDRFEAVLAMRLGDVAKDRDYLALFAAEFDAELEATCLQILDVPARSGSPVGPDLEDRARFVLADLRQRGGHSVRGALDRDARRLDELTRMEDERKRLDEQEWALRYVAVDSRVETLWILSFVMSGLVAAVYLIAATFSSGMVAAHQWVTPAVPFSWLLLLAAVLGPLAGGYLWIRSIENRSDVVAARTARAVIEARRPEVNQAIQFLRVTQPLSDTSTVLMTAPCLSCGTRSRVPALKCEGCGMDQLIPSKP